MTRRGCAAVLVAAMAVIAAPVVQAAAQTRITLNGARPSEWPIVDSLLAGAGLTQEAWLSFASRIGENWLPGTTPAPVNYPAQLGPVSGPFALTTDQSTAVGQQMLHDLITRELAKGEPVAVAGLSEGTLVIDRELAYLASLPTGEAPPSSALTFYVFGDMLRGFGQMYLKGLTIPIVGQTFSPVPQSQYDTVVVNEQWDGWANPPDRPWNLLSVLNAVMGAVYTVNGANDHAQTSLDSLSDAVKVSETTNSRGGTTTTYMVPRQQLPLTKPLLQLGVPTWVVDEIDKLLTPLILTGYSTMTPNWGPHIEQGQLVFTNPPAPVAEPTSTVVKHDAVDARTPLAAAAAPQSAVVAGGSLKDGSLKDEPAPAPRPRPDHVRQQAESDTTVDVDQLDRQPADAADADGALKGEPQAAPRPRPDHVRRQADSDSSTDVDQQRGTARRPSGHTPTDVEGTVDPPSQAEPSGDGKTGTASADTSGPTASAA